MRKLFSLIAAVLFAGSMMATEVTFTKDDFAGQGTANTGSEVSATKGGVTFTFSKGYCADESLRCYAHGALSITAETTIEKINFTTTGGKTGGLDAEVTVGATSYSVDDLASQARFTQIVVTLEGGEPVVEDTYTVAGSPASIFGEAWNPALEANDMKKVGGIYTWEKAGLELTPNDKIEFKVVKNHSWDIAFPASNFEISADEEGVYTLKIAFEPAIEEVAAVLEGAVVLPDPTNCAEAAEAALSVSANNELYNDGKEYTIEGYVTSIAYAWKEGSMSFWMADAADGGNVLEAYKCAIENEEDAVRVGDKVAVTGKLTKYNTTPEFAQGCTVVIIERAEVVEPKNLGEKTIAEFLELKNQRDTCILTGTVANVKNTEYGNFDLVELGNAEVSVYVYGLLTAAGEAKKCFAEENIAEGDTLKVLAIYSEYNAAPQVKNAIFVEVKHLPVAPADTITIDIEEEVEYIDQVANQGWWQFIAENDEYEISISNVSTTQAAGVYGIEDLDADYTYVTVKATETDVYFVDGEFTLTEGEDGSRTIVGLMTGDDGNIYDIKLVYSIPTAKTTVNVEIPEWGVANASEYFGIEGYVFYGEAEDGTYVQIVIPGSNPLGQFTYEDCYTGRTGIEVDGEFKSIYSMDLNVSVVDEKVVIIADILCLNNTLYHVTTAGALQGVNNVEAAQKAIKSIMNGQLVIEKNGKTFNAAGQMLK